MPYFPGNWPRGPGLERGSLHGETKDAAHIQTAAGPHLPHPPTTILRGRSRADPPQHARTTNGGRSVSLEGLQVKHGW